MSAGGHDLPRLLLISNMWPTEANPVYGGFVARHAAALTALGVPVTVVANTDPRTGVVRSLAKYRRLARRSRAAGRSGAFDAVVGHYLYPTAGMAHQAARLSGAALVLVVHGTDARSVMRRDPFAAAARRALAEADLVVAVSAALADSLRADVGVPESVPIATVHMGIDEAVFVPDPDARAALGIPEQERTVLFVGNLVAVKGLETLRAAFEMLLERKAADRLVIVGDGPLRQELTEWSSALELKDHVTVTGRLAQCDVARWMAAADVFVLPSHNEGLGLVLLEAMACGTPCVASAVGGVPEILDERTGALVPPGDGRALADAIDGVLAAGRGAYREACLAAARGHGATAQAEAFLGAVRRVVRAP
ncbi:MAG: glycosyltransferase [Coriobacteriia bacterium]|nr:glycosyltransferase [Coriobacteriia bacterium]